MDSWSCPDVIAISGKIGSGKDTLVRLITEHLATKGILVSHLKFAAKLKEMTSILTNTSIESGFTDEGKAVIPIGFKKSIGTLQQDIGTALRVYVDPNVWIYPVITQAILNARRNQNLNHNDNQSLLPEQQRIITLISDCRFTNEAVALKELNNTSSDIERWTPVKTVVIRLNRKVEITDGRNPFHISETDLDNYPDFDFVIDNNGTIEQLQQKVLYSLGV